MLPIPSTLNECQIEGANTHIAMKASEWKTTVKDFLEGTGKQDGSLKGDAPNSPKESERASSNLRTSRF